jgi:hypothetical protein
VRETHETSLHCNSLRARIGTWKYMRGRPFEPENKMGTGRPSGSRNRATVFREALDGSGEAIIRKIMRLALKSDPTAMRLCMERLLPLAKAPNSRFRLPPVATAANLMEAISAVTRAVAAGRLSAREGESVARIIESQRRMLETETFDARLRVLEGARPMIREGEER